MTMTDPVADMLTRLRNANSAYHDTVSMPSSKLKTRVAEILKAEGYIQDWREEAAEVGKTGSLHGEPIEGFVVRTTMPQTYASDAPRPPYAPGQVWFYKIKFDEPYLMYRDWRELTRTMLKEHDAWRAQNPLADAMERATPALAAISSSTSAWRSGNWPTSSGRMIGMSSPE